MSMTLGAYPPSARQKALLSKLILSSEFSDKETEDTINWLKSTRATTHGASILIDRALKRLKARDISRKKKKEIRKLAKIASDAIFKH